MSARFPSVSPFCGADCYESLIQDSPAIPIAVVILAQRPTHTDRCAMLEESVLISHLRALQTFSRAHFGMSLCIAVDRIEQKIEVN